jgi:sugar lactone lactonase YvrE
LIPEGIAVHPVTKDIYLSSINEDKLIKTNKKGKNQVVVINRKQNGYSFGLGLDFFDNYLYALSSLDRGARSILSIKNQLTNELSTYKLAERDSAQFNDLAIDSKGNAYITDSKNHEIFYYNNQQKKIIPFLKSEQFYYPNGIAINKEESKLFIASFSQGLRIVDIESKRIINSTHEASKNKGIDGLKFHKNRLYFIMNSRGENEIIRGLYSVNLNANQTDFGKIQTLLIDKDILQDPTTLSIVGDWIYVIGNTQLKEFDDHTQTVKDESKLEDIKIIKIKIEDGIGKR